MLDHSAALKWMNVCEFHQKILLKPSFSFLLRNICFLRDSPVDFADIRTALWIGGGNLTIQLKVTYFRVTGSPGGTWAKLHEQLPKLTVRIWCLYVCMKIAHSSFVEGTLPRLVGLKLALQLCFALQARACLFSSWKQLGVETHKKPALCEMQKEYVIFQDSLHLLLFVFPCFCHLFMMIIFSGWRPDLSSKCLSAAFA